MYAIQRNQPLRVKKMVVGFIALIIIIAPVM